MDHADLAARQQNAQGLLRADPLKGMNIEAEYRLIKSGRSRYSERIQQLIISRYELGK